MSANRKLFYINSTLNSENKVFFAIKDKGNLLAIFFEVEEVIEYFR